MHIHPPHITASETEVILTARINVDTPLEDLPQHLSFRFPAAYRPHINPRGDAWVTAMLPLAMHLGEDIHYPGALSERLFYGLGELVKIFSTWLPEVFHPIRIHPARLEPSTTRPGSATLAAFSGGVDSSYVVFNHLPPRQEIPALQVTHCVFIHGFDIPLQETAEYDAWQAIFGETLSGLGIELIAARTNAQYFTTGRVRWEYAHGCALAAVGLMLEPFCKQYLIASSWQLTRLKPWGSSIVTDHWFSTETMAVRHSGVEAGRFAKVETVKNWPPLRSMLRVCVDYPRRSPGKNCSCCEKCRRTLAMLAVLEAEGSFQTFIRPPHLRDVLNWVPSYRIYVPDMLRYCWQQGKLRAVPLLILAQARYLLHQAVRSLVPAWLFRRLKAKLYPLSENPFTVRHLPLDWH
ncbi:MAG: hypothetical protein HPY85_09665 [Anaerolineae bacterium]|nr:hypothetical protein [Anaerolineae bacterium]